MARRSSVTGYLCFLAVLAPPAVLAQSDPERIQRLEEQIEAQQRMIERQQQVLEKMSEELESLKAQDAEAIEAPAPLPSRPVEATRQADAENASFEFYGQIQLDAIYDFKRVNPDYEATLRPSTIPTQQGLFGEDGVSIISVRQSALGMRARFPTGMGTFKTWFEFDLFGTGGDAGQTTFNFRHGWVEIGGLGFGQTNSTFMDISIFPNVIDWWGPSGMVFNRNPQIRYTWFMDDAEFAVALEKPNGSFNAGIFGELSPEFGDAVESSTPLPDITAHWRNTYDWGHYQLAGVLRRLSFDTRGTPDNEPKDDVFGWGLNLTGVINTFGRDQLKLGLVYGEGIASFFNDGGVNLAPQDFEADAVPHLGITAYYDHYWSDAWSSSVGFSINDADVRNQQAAAEFDRGTYASTNLLYTPNPYFLMGVEFLYGRHEDVAGRTGEDYRTQFSVKHKFSSTAD